MLFCRLFFLVLTCLKTRENVNLVFRKKTWVYKNTNALCVDAKIKIKPFLSEIKSDRKIGKLLVGKRMIHRFHEQVFQRMPTERRARKLAVMKALAKSFKIKNKENEDPLNNNMALSFNFTHSTPVKNQQVTDLDDIESEAELTGSELCGIEERDEETFWKEDEEVDEVPKLVISKMYDLEDHRRRLNSENSCECQEEGNEDPDLTVMELKNIDERSEKQWRSLEALHKTAEYEFCRSLEESKLFVSTSSLLEEIEADLPSPYSLARPLNHTFHTLTSYRTQTRLARVDGNLTCPEILKQRESLEVNIPSKKIDRLEMEASVQKALAEQAEKALILSKTNKLFGVQHVECEKALLLANLRFINVVQEEKKLRMLGETEEKENFGQVTISDIYFEVNDSKDYYPEKYICTATERENVQSTSVIGEVTDGNLHFNEPLKFSNLSRDFVIHIDLFKLIYKEPRKGSLTTALVRKLKKMTGGNLDRSLTPSPYSSSGFVCIAQGELRLENVVGGKDEKCIIQNNLTVNLSHPIVGSTISLFAKTDIQLNSKKSGFLNVFKQTWHRQWYSQSGYFLESWLYPEDQESDKAQLDSIYLPNCSSVQAVGLEVCVRPHSFVIKLKETNEEILFSADSHKDLISWVDHLNFTLELIQIWKPDV